MRLDLLGDALEFAQRPSRPDVSRHHLCRAIDSGIDDGLGDITSKATGLELVCQRLGLTSRDVLAIGNDTNDIGMFEWAGHSAFCHSDWRLSTAPVARSTVLPYPCLLLELTPCMHAGAHAQAS